jgi:hypothetical protein
MNETTRYLQSVSSEEIEIASLVNYMVFDAVRAGASDIHIEPSRKYSAVRFRVDGQMYEALRPRSRAGRGDCNGNNDKASQSACHGPASYAAFLVARKSPIRASALRMFSVELA